MVSVEGGAEVRISLPELPVRMRVSRWLGDDALFDFCSKNQDVRIERTADGEVWIMAPTGGDTGWRNAELIVQLGQWSRQDGTGRTFDSSTGFSLPNGAMRSPDASWVQNERWNAIAVDRRRGFPPVCPDFVIELLSPSDELPIAHAKMREYVENGAKLGWLVDPDARVAWVYHLDGRVERHASPTSLDAGPVLPGFVLDLLPIW